MPRIARKYIYSAGVGALLARALPMAAVVSAWNFSAIFGTALGCTLSVLMLCAFCAVLFLLEADSEYNQKGQLRKVEFCEGLCLALYGLQTAMLPGFVHSPDRGIHIAAVGLDCLVIILSIVFTSPWYNRKRMGFAVRKTAVWAMVFAAEICVLPGILAGMEMMDADRLRSALVTLAAAGLVYSAVSRLRSGPYSISWPGMLTGIAVILLIDIVI